MGWRVKIIFVLMVYFSGFASAIYWLAPNPETSQGSSSRFRLSNGEYSKEDLTQKMNSGMHKAMGLSREAAEQAGKLIQQKIIEYQGRAVSEDD